MISIHCFDEEDDDGDGGGGNMSGIAGNIRWSPNCHVPMTCRMFTGPLHPKVRRWHDSLTIQLCQVHLNIS